MKTDLRYTPTDCFETFPFVRDHALQSIGERYYIHRQHVMKELSCGMTQVYNLLHDRAAEASYIKQLRDLHVELDRLVATAYEWDDIDLDHCFHETKQGVRFTVSESTRREILQRLLKLNHKRYEEEVAQGLHDKKAKRATKGKQKAKKKKAPKPTPALTLFDMGDEETTFPARDSDRFLCGLLCDLVSDTPGLALTAYRDAFVIFLRFERHSRLLIGDEQSQFVKLCKSLPKERRQPALQLPWTDLVELLTVRKALVFDKGRSLKCGSKLKEVRPSYPECDSELVSLILKAAAALREQQESAKPEMPDELSDFREDVKSLCGESP